MVKMPIKIYLGDRRFEHQTEENQTSNEKIGLNTKLRKIRHPMKRWEENMKLLTGHLV
jgi:hypothetical protein